MVSGFPMPDVRELQPDGDGVEQAHQAHCNGRGFRHRGVLTLPLRNASRMRNGTATAGWPDGKRIDIAL